MSTSRRGTGIFHARVFSELRHELAKQLILFSQLSWGTAEFLIAWKGDNTKAVFKKVPDLTKTCKGP